MIYLTKIPRTSFSQILIHQDPGEEIGLFLNLIHQDLMTKNGTTEPIVIVRHIVADLVKDGFNAFRFR